MCRANQRPGLRHCEVISLVFCPSFNFTFDVEALAHVMGCFVLNTQGRISGWWGRGGGFRQGIHMVEAYGAQGRISGGQGVHM